MEKKLFSLEHSVRALNDTSNTAQITFAALTYLGHVNPF